MWKCRQCGETRQRNFSTCRSCGRPRRSSSSAGLRTIKLTQAALPAALRAAPVVVPAACPECCSSKMMIGVRILEHGPISPDTQVEVQRNPAALMFKQPERQNLRARICGACGYTVLYAENPHLLWAAYEAAQQHSQGGS